MIRMMFKQSFILLFFLLVSLILAFPCLLHMHDEVIGDINHPGLQGELFLEKNIFYNMQKGNLVHYYITDLVNYPRGQNLGPIIANSLHLFFSLPLQILFGQIVSYNILVIIIFALNGFAMYILARDFFSSKSIAIVTGLFFMFNSYVLLKANMGFLIKITLFWIPLYFLSIFRLRNGNRILYIFLSSFLLFLVQWTYSPYAYYVILFTIILVIYDLIQSRGSFYFVRNFILMMALFLGLAFIYQYRHGISFLLHPYESFYSTPELLAKDGYMDIFHAFKFYPYHSQTYPVHLPLGLSFIAIVLGVFAAIRKEGIPRFLFISLAIFILIAMGTYLTINGKPLLISGHKIILPYYVLLNYFPYGWFLIFPIRSFPILNICLALLIGYALTNLTKNKKIKPILTCLLFTICYVFETLVVFPELFPLTLSKVEIPEFYKKIKNEKFEAILNLPHRSERAVMNLYCYYAALSEKKVMNPYDRAELPIAFPKNKDDWNEQRQFIVQLSKWDVRYIVIHRKLFRNRVSCVNFLREIEWLKLFCGIPEDFKEDGILVYRVPTHEKILIIPDDYRTIQEAINVIDRKAIILVRPGVYRENIDFLGKSVYLKSLAGPEVTFIDGCFKGSVVRFISGETRDSGIEGFTIQNGTGDLNLNFSSKVQGGGIYCYGSAPIIKNNIIKNNQAENGGGILCFNRSSPEIKNNIITRNTAVKGGGIRCSESSSPKIMNNTITENKASRLGGGIYWRVNSNPVIANNLILNNKSGEYGGGLFGSGGSPTINNCLIWGNISFLGSQIGLGYSDAKINISQTSIENKRDAIYDPYAILNILNTEL